MSNEDLNNKKIKKRYLFEGVDDIVVIEWSMRVEDKSLNSRFLPIIPKLGLIYLTTTVNKDYTSDLANINT
jgi:hypothetical protein